MAVAAPCISSSASISTMLVMLLADDVMMPGQSMFTVATLP